MRLPTILLLHLAPGALVLVVYLIGAPIAVANGLPRVAALLLGFVIAGMPFQLVMTRRLGIAYRQPMPWWQYVVLTLAVIALCTALLFLPLSPVSDYLATRAFAWAPAAMLPSDAEPPHTAAVLFVLVAQLLIDGFANPIVEERYFRGALLPRLAPLGAAAPFVNTALFTLAHFWQPSNYVTIFVNVLPLTFVTWWKRNIWIQTFVHCLANTVGAAMALM